MSRKGHSAGPDLREARPRTARGERRAGPHALLYFTNTIALLAEVPAAFTRQ